MKLITIAALAFYTTNVFGKSPSPLECFPNKKLNLELKSINDNSTWTEPEARIFLQKIKDVYEPIVAQMGKTIEIGVNWHIDEFNASAHQTGDTLYLNFEGGLLRTLENEKDAILLVACHEVGHHVAGYPFYEKSNLSWASSEGQSDYFATHVCLPKIWENDFTENARARTTVHPKAKESCDRAYSNINEQNICYRSVMAAYVKERTSASLGNYPLPDFDTPTDHRVTQTRNSHPDNQCRIDTALNGAICTKSWDDTIIPGKSNPNGQNSKEAELISSNYSCHIDDNYEAMRPVCWFLTKLSPHLSKESIKFEDENNNGIFEMGEMIAVNIPLINDSVLELDQLELEVRDVRQNLLATNTYFNVPAHSQEYSNNTQSFSTSNWRCGDTASLYNSFEYHGKKVSNYIDFKVGTPYTVNTLSKVVNLQIPKNDQIEISINNTLNPQIGKVVVKVEIDEPAGSKLRGELYQPIFSSPILKGYLSSLDNKINPVTSLNTMNINGSGEWILKFKDLGSEDALSTIRRVEIEFIGYNCNSPVAI